MVKVRKDSSTKFPGNIILIRQKTCRPIKLPEFIYFGLKGPCKFCNKVALKHFWILQFFFFGQCILLAHEPSLEFFLEVRGTLSVYMSICVFVMFIHLTQLKLLTTFSFVIEKVKLQLNFCN